MNRIEELVGENQIGPEKAAPSLTEIYECAIRAGMLFKQINNEQVRKLRDDYQNNLD